MASQIDICNQALAHIGADMINDINEASAGAKHCRLFFSSARDIVLRDHFWNFAAKTISLAPLSITPVGFDYAYTYPTDCIRVKAIWQAVTTADPIKYEVRAKEGGGLMILTDEADAILEYTARITDAGQFDPTFADALSWRLAADLAMPLSKSLPIKQAMLTVYTNRLVQAEALDSREGRIDQEANSPWVRARL